MSKQSPESSSRDENSRSTDLPFLIILLTGQLPGTGSSTNAEFLSKTFNLESFGGGFFRRAMALHWQEFSTPFFKAYTQDFQKINTAFTQLYQNSFFSPQVAKNWQEAQAFFFEEAQRELQLVWDKFAFIYEGLITSPKQLYAQIAPFLARKAEFNEPTLLNFNRAQQVQGKNQKFWDKVPEIMGTVRLTDTVNMDPEQNGKVYEAKLAALLPEITGFKEVLSEFRENFPVVILRFLLKVDYDLSAYRVLEREVTKKKPKSLPTDVTFANYEEMNTKCDELTKEGFIPLPVNPLAAEDLEMNLNPEEAHRSRVLKWLRSYPNFIQSNTPEGYDMQALLRWFELSVYRFGLSNFERMERDWEEYPRIYQIDGKPIQQSDLTSAGIIEIDANKTLEEVQISILRAILEAAPSYSTIILAKIAELEEQRAANIKLDLQSSKIQERLIDASELVGGTQPFAELE